MTLPNTDSGHSPELHARLDAFFAEMGQGMNAYVVAESRRAELGGLDSKSDAELAEMGLKRSEIVRHVFRDLLQV